MSKQKELTAAIKARLATITIANGFLTDIGLRVFVNREKIDVSELPCIALVEGDEDEVLDERVNDVSVAIPFRIQGNDACNPEDPLDKAHDIVADITRCIFSGDPTFGDLVRGNAASGPGLKYKGRSFGPRADGAKVIAAYVDIECRTVFNKTSP